MAEGGSKYEVGETSTKNQTADDHVSEHLQIAGNEAKGSRGYFNRRLINWRISYCHYLMGPCVLNSAKALKQSKTEPSAQDGMENEDGETSKKQVVTNFLRFDEAVEYLRKERDNLTLLREKLQFFVEAAKRRNEDIAFEVEKWLTDADNVLDDAQMLENEIKENKRLFFNMSPNWRWRYRLTKEVAKRMLTVTALASQFEQVRSLAKLSGQEFFLSEGYVLLDTHLSAVSQIMDALNDERVYLIGLHGVGGVGKTALAKEVGKMAKKLRLFEKVVMVYLSLAPNIKSIQDEIAESLEFTFEDQGADRKEQLGSRLSAEKSILIIVDDFWRYLDLEDIGIPIYADGPGRKLLLTTRREEVRFNYYSNESEMMVRLNRLTIAEAMDLFKMTTGLNRTSSVFNEVAIVIVKESNGLPIAIQVAAKALSGKTLEEWKEASANFRGKTLEEWRGFCQILGRHALIDESFEKVFYGFKQLKSSYDRLSRETKLCFLLYSLFPEVDKIHIEDLVGCAIGMELYGEDKIEQYRRALFQATQELKDSELLLDDVKEYILTMTKMIHDAALEIASKEEEFKITYKVGLEEWPKNESFELYTAISMMNTKIKELKERFASEKLKILLLDGDGSMTISSTSKFFEGLEALKVFILLDGCLSLQALQSLTDLRTLRLKQCKLHDISSLEKLKTLEILCFHGSDIRELPKQIGELHCLRMLDLSECQELQKIHPNVIQRLCRLEELLISDSFENWGLEETNAEDRNASLSELNALDNLCGLSLKFRSEHLPKDFVFPSLEYFQIAINENGWFEDCYYPKSLKVSTTSSLNALKELFGNVRDLHLNCITGYQNLLPGFMLFSLCFLSLTCCQSMECLVDTTKLSEPIQAFVHLRGLFIEEMSDLKILCKGQPPNLLFIFLETLTVTKCNNLIAAVPRVNLDMLQEMRVIDCDQMEQIFHEIDEPNNTSGEILHAGTKDLVAYFSSLTNLKLVNLTELRCIWNPNLRLCVPRLRNLEITNCSKLETVFPSPTSKVGGDFLHPRVRGELKRLPPLNPCNGYQTQQIMMLSVLSLNDILNNGSPQSKQGFHQANEVERDNIMLPQLRQVVLRSLKNLRSFCAGMDFIPLPSLEELVVEECPQLKPFIIPLDATKRFHLKELSLAKVGIATQSGLIRPQWDRKFPNSEYVVVGDFEEIFQVAGGYFFSKLEKLVVRDLSQLKVIWKDRTQILTFQNLTYFELANCEGMRNVFSLVAARNLPQLTHLKIQGCDNLEQIIIQDQIASASKAHIGDIYFPNLITVHVEKCNQLKSLFPICVANLPKLEKFLVKEAFILKQIFEHEGEANIVLDKEMMFKYEKEVVLSELKVLLLEDLPSLLSFIPMGYHFKFPSLASLTIRKCPRIVTSFSCDLNDAVHAKTEETVQEDTLRTLSAPTRAGRKIQSKHKRKTQGTSDGDVIWSRYHLAAK